MDDKEADEIAGGLHAAMFPDRVNYLTVEQAFVLNEACRIVLDAFTHCCYGVYQVGSSLFRPNYRDVDVRCIIPRENWPVAFGSNDSTTVKFLNVAISCYLRERTGLPVDFQFQIAELANEEYPSGSKGQHRRSALGHSIK